MARRSGTADPPPSTCRSTSRMARSSRSPDLLAWRIAWIAAAALAGSAVSCRPAAVAWTLIIAIECATTSCSSRAIRIRSASTRRRVSSHMHTGAGHIQTISVGQVIGVAVAASLVGWLLLALLERRTPQARLLWTTIALAALAASLALPLALATTSSAAAGLIVLHLTVAAAVIPAMAHTARTR